MKKFTKYTQEKVEENKVFDKHMELTQELFKGLKESIIDKGYVIEDEDLDDYIFQRISEISKVLVDPNTLPSKPGTQVKLDLDLD